MVQAMRLHASLRHAVDRIGAALAPIATIPWRVALAVTGLLFFWVTGNGVLQGGMNPDDWRQLAGVPEEWGEPLGRWGMDLTYRYLLGGRFSEPLQLIFAYLCFLFTSRAIAKVAVDEPYAPFATTVILLAAVNHPYMLDVLNFSAHVFGYPFALALSAAGFGLALKPPDGAWRTAGRVLAGAQLVALSLAFYPSFALLGILLVALVLLRVDRYDAKTAVRALIVGGVIGLSGALLFLAQWQLFRLATEFYPIRDPRLVVSGTVGFSIDLLQTKLQALPDFLRGLYGAWLWPIRPANLFYYAFAACGAGLCVAGVVVDQMHRRGRMERLIAAIRGFGGLGLAVALVPTLFWFAQVEMEASGRRAAHVALVLPALILVGAQLLQGRRADDRRATMAFAAVVPLSLACIVSLLVASAIWNDQQRTAQRDAALATSILARASALEGFDGRSLAVVTLPSPGPRWGSSLSWSAFAPGDDANRIFQEFLGFGGRVSSFRRSPVPCSAYPANDATFLYGGTAFVCLKDDSGLLPLEQCTTLKGKSVNRVCVSDGRDLVLTLRDCSTVDHGRYFVRTSGPKGESVHHLTFIASPDLVHPVTRECYYDHRLEPGATKVVVGQYPSPGVAAWAQTLQLR